MYAATLNSIGSIISHVKWGLEFLLNNQPSLPSSSCRPHVQHLIDAHTERRTACKSGDDDDCAVCLCGISTGEEIRRLSCSHVFHSVCLDRWIGHGWWTCPLCRNHLMHAPGPDTGEIRREIVIFNFAEVRSWDDKDSWWLR